MSGSEARDTVHLKRRRLIERLNAREAELAVSQGGHLTGSKERSYFEALATRQPVDSVRTTVALDP